MFIYEFYSFLDVYFDRLKSEMISVNSEFSMCQIPYSHQLCQNSLGSWRLLFEPAYEHKNILLVFTLDGQKDLDILFPRLESKCFGACSDNQIHRKSYRRKICRCGSSSDDCQIPLSAGYYGSLIHSWPPALQMS